MQDVKQVKAASMMSLFAQDVSHTNILLSCFVLVFIFWVFVAAASVSDAPYTRRTASGRFAERERGREGERVGERETRKKKGKKERQE